MQSNDTNDASVSSSSIETFPNADFTPLSSNPEPKPRKQWINFEEKDAEDECDGPLDHVTVSIDNDDNGTSVATIEPSHSIQITNPAEVSGNTPGIEYRRSMSPEVSKLQSLRQSSSVTDPVTDNNINNYHKRQSTESTNVNTLQNIPLKEINTLSNDGAHRNHLPSSSQSYSNGDVIVTLLPLNSHCAWLTPAAFKPELVPEELMAQCLTLTVEDYVSAMQVLVNDLRFNLYITLYKRILVIWIALGFVVLLTLLFSGVHGLALFGGGVLWLIINAIGIFISMWFKIKLYHMLERCMAQVNSMLYKYNILVGIDDRGKLSCHKINLVFIYFDVSSCIKFLKDMIDNEDQLQNSSQASRSNSTINPLHMDINTSDIIITGVTPKSLPQKEKYAEKLLLRYSQRWVKEYVRRRMDLNLPIHGDASVTPTPSITPRHCISSRCPCQYIEEHLRFKPLAHFSISELFT